MLIVFLFKCWNEKRSIPAKSGRSEPKNAENYK